MFIAPRPPADENAGVGGAIKLRSGLGGGLRGIGGSATGPLKPLAATSGKAAPGGPSKPGQTFSAQPRAILGNLTNVSAKPGSSSAALTSGKKAQPLQPQAAHSERENMAGKSWKAQEGERVTQEAHGITTRVNRTIAAVSTWKTAPFFILADDDENSASEVDEPVHENEPLIVVSLPKSVPSSRGDENAAPAATGTAMAAGARLPDLGAEPLDLAFDFDTEDEDAALL